MEEVVLEKIERYLKKLMNSEERDAFEKEMKEHPSLQQKVNEYQKVFTTFDAIQQRSALKSKLDAFHNELPKQGKVVSFTDYFKEKKFAIAASVALLLSFGTAGYLLMQKNAEGVEVTKNEAERSRAPQPQKKKIIMKNEAQYTATAFMVSTKGYLVTAKHIVDDVDEIVVENSDGEQFKAELVYMDPKKDLAFLRITDTSFVSPKALPYAFAGDISELGERVFTLGFPQENIIYEEGVMSGRCGFQGDKASCQISLSVNLGNSGGPLFDDKGNVIGMISSRQKDKDRVGFAITVKSITDAYKNAPKGTFDAKLKFNSSNKISGLKRSKQIKKLESFVYQVKVD
ncbi:MAG: serine protease [Bacteroidetes bacterium]|nr:serine protease [Bacteroidota bacterium]